ncbi:zinc finger, SWIM-type containing protein [Tanacetum coccineum]
MTTSSTSSLLPANSPTTNLPQATTSNLPPATSTTTNLPPATSTTSHLLLATSTTSHLPSATSSTSHLLTSTSMARACNINEADLFVVPVVGEENLLIEAEIEELDDVTMNEDVEANVILEPVKINTPRPSLYLHNETPGGTTYWEPNVDEPYLPLEGKRFDTIEECVEFYSVYAEKGGGTQYVHGTSDDFKNHIRDVNAFIGESDAQMLINKMENRKKFVPNFTFHYLVENSELVAMFWADEVAKCNYKEFGDIISFDATFRTNKYDMVFVPFTGIDNHLKCVNFGSGMLLREDEWGMWVWGRSWIGWLHRDNNTWLTNIIHAHKMKSNRHGFKRSRWSNEKGNEAVLQKLHTDKHLSYHAKSSSKVFEISFPLIYQSLKDEFIMISP